MIIVKQAAKAVLIGAALVLISACSSLSPKPKEVADVVSYPEPWNKPIATQYSDKRVSQARQVDVTKLSLLKIESFPFTQEQVYLSFAQPIGYNRAIEPVALAVGYPKDIENGDPSKLLAALSYNDCIFRLTYIGSDEHDFRYFQQISDKSNPQSCSNNELLRVETLKDASLRVSGHDGINGRELWAGVFLGRALR